MKSNWQPKLQCQAKDNGDHPTHKYMARPMQSAAMNDNNDDDETTSVLSHSSNNDASGHYDDDSSYMRSIMERRRHIKPKEKDSGEEDRSVATNAPLLPSPPHRQRIATSRRSNRRLSISSFDSHRRRPIERERVPINPIYLIVLLVLASNWLASLILDELFQTNDEKAIQLSLPRREEIDAAANAHVMNQEHIMIIDDNVAQHVDAIIAENRAYQSEGEQVIGRPSLNKLSQLPEGIELTEAEEGTKLSESEVFIPPPPPPPLILNGEQHLILDESDSSNYGEKHQDEEMQAKLKRIRNEITELKEHLVTTSKDVITESNLDEEMTQQQSSSPVTERYIHLRQRLLPLYSEPVPTKPDDEHMNATHPLFNKQSPQFQALSWLSNIDKSQITDDDPHVIQRYVLSVLYFATGGPPIGYDNDFSLKRRGGAWRNPTNFLSNDHECEWKSSVTNHEGRGGGIRRCDADKNVVELSIYNELAGTIPSELGRLSFLRTLYLGRNNLVGTIPSELGMIHPIASISLQYNQLTGEIPQHDLNRIPTLRFLQLEGNPLRGKIKKDDPLCQMRDKHKAKNAESGHKRVLRVLSATCIPSVGGDGPLEDDMLECECCTKCFAKEKDMDQW